MKDSLRTIVNHQGCRLSLDVWSDGLDERDSSNKQYKFGMQIIQIPMSGMIRFDAHFMHDQFGNSMDLDKVLPNVSRMIENHIEVFITGRVPQELCQKWLLEARGRS